jgi:hypothetical protein
MIGTVTIGELRLRAAAAVWILLDRVLYNG